MTLDPRVAMYLNLIVAFLFPLGGYLAANTHFMHTQIGIWTVLVIGAIVAGINGILHAIPSANTPEDQKKFFLGPKPK